jgi:hypothetical protein
VTGSIKYLVLEVRDKIQSYKVQIVEKSDQAQMMIGLVHKLQTVFQVKKEGIKSQDGAQSTW